MKKQQLLETRAHGTPHFPIECFISHCPKEGLFIPLHWHSSVEILYFLQGTAKLTLGNHTYQTQADDLFFVNQEELHRIVAQDETLSYDTIIFSLPALRFSVADSAQSYLMPLLHNQVRFPEQVTSAAMRQELVSLVAQMMDCTSKKLPGYELMAKSLLLQMIAVFLAHRALYPAERAVLEKSQRLKQMLEYLQNHLSDPLSIAVMAQTFHLSEKYFSRYFRTATGQNFTAYLNAIRMEHACTLLQETDLSVLEIALECGYENISYFNRVFRRQMHQSPTQYRTSQKGENSAFLYNF